MAVPYKLSTITKGSVQLAVPVGCTFPESSHIEETFHVIIRKSDKEIVDFMSANEPGAKEYMKNTLARMNTNSVLNDLGV